jgi:hypothetical protein
MYKQTRDNMDNLIGLVGAEPGAHKNETFVSMFPLLSGLTIFFFIVQVGMSLFFDALT